MRGTFCILSGPWGGSISSLGGPESLGVPRFWSEVRDLGVQGVWPWTRAVRLAGHAALMTNSSRVGEAGTESHQEEEMDVHRSLSTATEPDKNKSWAERGHGHYLVPGKKRAASRFCAV